MDEAMLDSQARHDHLPQPVRRRSPASASVPVMLDSSKWSVIEAGLKCVQGRSVVNSVSLKEGEAEFLRQASLVRRYGAAVVVMAFDEQGQADTVDRRVAIAERAFRLLVDRVGFAPEDIIIDPNIFAIATGIEQHDNYAVDYFEATRRIKAALPAREHQRRPEQRLVLVPWQQRRCARRSTPCSCTTPCAPGWTWAS